MAGPVDRTAGGTVAISRSALPRAWVAYDWLQASGQTNSFALTVRRTTVQLDDRPVIEGAPLTAAWSGADADHSSDHI